MSTLAEQLEAQEREQIKRAVDWAGSQRRLASYLGVSRQVVNGWVSRGRISATKAAELEKATNGYFKKSEMRPDVKEWYL
jgi:DNA-binding transcriptional regulator YdaS (Cro superfamily)